MNILSTKMASKRLSDTDTIYPPKKRAVYEHMKLHGIEKFTANQIASNGILEYSDGLRMYGMSLPVNIDIKHSESFTRQRSDSLQSQLSSNSDHTETGSTESRETSPCTIQALFDHHTPERNPITSLDGLKPDISKPLFPPSDSENSTAGSEGHLSPGNSLYGEAEETEFDHFENGKVVTGALKRSDQVKTDNGKIGNIIAERQTLRENIPENRNVSETFHKTSVANSSFQNENIPRKNGQLQTGDNIESGYTFTSQTEKEVYMGPMVSLLHRFNAEALQSNVGLKIQEHLTEQEVEKSVHHTSLLKHRASLDYTTKQSEPLGHLQSDLNTYLAPIEINGVLSEKIFCRLCNKEFATRAYLHNHMKTHENKCIPCWVCKQVFQTAEGLNVHMKTEHKGENPYKCEHCSREFTQYNNLRRHMRVHREKVYKCNLCNREFNEEFYLKMHMGTHTGKRVYSCGVCGEGFSSNHDLKMHVKTHSPSLLHTCNVCGKSFSKACVLRQHKKGHSGERPHKCDKCEKTFIHRHHLTMHLKSHLDDKRLRCDICKKEFSQHSHLYKHLRAHEEMKDTSKDLKFSQNVAKDGGETSEKMEKTVPDDRNAKRVPKVVLTSAEFSSGRVKNEGSEKHFVADGLKETSKPPRQRRRAISQHSLPQNSHHNMSASSATENNKPLPSLSQTFSPQMPGYSSMPRYPSMPFVHGMTQSYLPGSQAHPFALYSPLRNGVPVSLPGYQPYSEMYRDYSEKMHTYYNNMYMMNYLSQNAILQNANEGHRFPNIPESESFMHKKENARSNQHSTFKMHDILKPKVVHGIEKLDTVQDFKVLVEEDRNLKEQSGSDSGVHEQEDIDVVNETVENELEVLERRKDSENVKNGINKDVQESEEHEIAQELLKMSAGNEALPSQPDIRETKLRNQNDTPNTESGMHGVNFTNCINDIIERTIRNSNGNAENIPEPKIEDTTTLNYVPFVSVSKSDEDEQVNVSNAVNYNQEIPVNVSWNKDLKSKLPVRETEIYSNSRFGDANKVAESPTSPLQKLKMFVASEKTNFNETETITEHFSPSINYENELINQRSENSKADTNDLGKQENECFESAVKLPVGKEVEDENETRTVEESIEERLEKIRQFANIGQRLGKIQSQEHIENKEFENTDESPDFAIEMEENDVVYNEKEVQDTRYEITQPRRDVWSVKEEGVSDLGSENGKEVEKLDIAGYFNDSLEDRQLEIVESEKVKEDFEGHKGYFNDSLEDRQLEIVESEKVKEDFEGHKESREGSESSSESSKLSKKEFTFTEKEFLSHMSDMIDVSGEKVGNGNELKEESNTAAEDEENFTDIDKQNHLDDVYSEVKENEINAGLQYGNCHLKQIQGLEASDKTTEGGAVDLRTQIRQNECLVNETDFVEKDIQQRFENENVPMDLSLNGKRKHESNERVGNCENKRFSSENRHNKAGLSASVYLGSNWKSVDSATELKSKQIEYAKSNGIHCNMCSISFTSAVEYQWHMSKHGELKSSSDVIATNLSNQSACDRRSEVKLKEQKESPDFQNSSMQCVNESEQGELLKNEISKRSEFGENLLFCQFCDKTFDQSDKWTEHVNFHKAMDKPYVCTTCQRSFAHRHNLNRHKMSHNSKSYECNVCNRSFKESFYLQMHMKKHEEENRHKCQICGQNVPKAEIWWHTSQHLGNISENPTYQQIGYRVQEILQEQNLNVSSKPEKFETGNFSTNLRKIPVIDGTAVGLKRVMESRVVYSEDDSHGHEALNLKKENIENWNQNVGGIDMRKIFHPTKMYGAKGVSVLSERKMEDSLRNCNGKPGYGCSVCNKILQTQHELENHMGFHNGTRPYACNICGRTFKKKRGLRTHEKLHLNPSIQV